MDPVFPDPDVKIYMSLDEIILLTKGEWKRHPRRKPGRCQREKMSQKKIDESKKHSVPLLGSQNGVDIHVSKKSPLLSVENRRRVIQAVGHDVEVVKISKKIIPTKYKLIKTSNGYERVVVPSVNYVKSTMRNIKSPRKLLKDTNRKLVEDLLEKKPPPLIRTLILSPPRKLIDETPMDVDKDDDDEIILHFQRELQK